MSKAIKKALSVLLCAALLFGAAPLNGFVGLYFPKLNLPSLSSLFAVKAQAEDNPTSGTCGANITWSLDMETGAFTMSGSGEMYEYDHSGNWIPWYHVEDSIKSVTIENGITTISAFSFFSCDNLDRVTIPDSVTSIGEQAFCYCYNLLNLVVPDSVVEIASNAFIHVGNISYFGTAADSPWGARSLNGFVDGLLVYDSTEKKEIRACSQMIQGSVTIPSSVTNIGEEAFYGCAYLVSIDIPDSVLNIGDRAFSGCKGFTNVSIPNSVRSIGRYAFSECSGLVNLTVPASVRSIGSKAFYNVRNIMYSGNLSGTPGVHGISTNM